MTTNQAAERIAEISEKLCREHYSVATHDTWYAGGSSHNDDRLIARVDRSSNTIKVSDGNHGETYTGPLDDDSIRSYVAEWLESVWSA